MTDYQDVIQQTCPVEIVQHFQTIQVSGRASVFWPEGYVDGPDFPKECMAAMVAAVGQRLDPQAEQRVLASYFYHAWLVPDHLSEDAVSRLGQIAGDVVIGDDLQLQYFRALRAHKIDVREEIAPQFVVGPATAFDRQDRMYQYQLYRAMLGEPGVMGWFQDLADRTIKPDDIMSIQDDLEEVGAPGWREFVQQYIDDNRQGPGVDGCGSLIIAHNARILLNMQPLEHIEGVIVREPQENGRVFAGCTPER